MEDATPLQIRPNVPKMLKLVPFSSLEKRKAVSRTVNVGNLPSSRGKKRAKVDPSSRGKAPLVESNSSPAENPIEVPSSEVPSSEVPSSEAPPCPNPESSKTPSMSTSFTFIRGEALAWNRFKMVVKEDDVMACYDMSVKEFEHSTIHDLFKVLIFIHYEL